MKAKERPRESGGALRSCTNSLNTLLAAKTVAGRVKQS